MKRSMIRVASAALVVGAMLVLLSCSDPGASPKRAYEVGYCGDIVAANGTGAQDRTDDMLVLFTKAKLASYVGGEVRSIKVGYCDFYMNPATYDYEVEIYAGGSGGAPGAKLFDKAVTLSKGWNDIPLDASVAVESDTMLWAGYSINTKNGWPLAFDGNDRVAGTTFRKMGDSAAYEEYGQHNLCVRLEIWK
jgi:hypothetical protein